MKYYFVIVYIVFSVFSVKCVLGCFYSGGNTIFNCSNDKWNEVPPRSLFANSIEVLDLSQNHIRDLLNNSFKWYSNVRVLLLQQNVLYSIEENALSPLSKLRTLDLSENAFLFIPCNLPSSLLHLNLGGNPIPDPDDCLHCLSPLTSLETLSLRHSRLKNFPRFCQPSPSIVELDVSEISFDFINVDDLALLCGLQQINISSVRISQHNDSCQSLQFVKWLTDHDITTTGNIQGIDDDPLTNCSSTPTKETMAVYQRCRYKLYFQKYLWVVIGGCILLVSCILIAIYALWWRKRKRLSKKLNFESSSSMTVAFENRSSDEKTDVI